MQCSQRKRRHKCSQKKPSSSQQCLFSLHLSLLLLETAGRVDMAAIRGDKGATEGVVETAVVGVTVAQVEMVDTEARAAEMVATAAIPNN
jgi:hypothetical protein